MGGIYPLGDKELLNVCGCVAFSPSRYGKATVTQVGVIGQDDGVIGTIKGNGRFKFAITHLCGAIGECTGSPKLL